MLITISTPDNMREIATILVQHYDPNNENGSWYVATLTTPDETTGTRLYFEGIDLSEDLAMRRAIALAIKHDNNRYNTWLQDDFEVEIYEG